MFLTRTLPRQQHVINQFCVRKLSTNQTQNSVFLIRPDGRYTKSSLTTSECLNLLPPSMRLQDLRSGGTRQISNFLVRGKLGATHSQRTDDYVVVIVEHIMAIITSRECLLLRADSENIASLASKLSVALRNQHSPVRTKRDD